MHFTGARPSPQIILLNHDIRTQQIHAQLKNTSKVKQTSHHINKMFARPKKAKQHHTTKQRLNHQLRRSQTKDKEGNISTLSTEWTISISFQNNNTNHGEECLLHQLATVQASTKDKDGNTTKRHLEDDEILAHVLAMLNETFETVSSAILFILYELALHSGVQDKLYEEITENINIEVYLYFQSKPLMHLGFTC